jgi:inhibitor of KinA
MTGQADPGPALSEPRFLDAGEAALVVQFGETVDPAVNDRVLARDAVLRADPPAATAAIGKIRDLPEAQAAFNG